jgi:NitT/TauT family transport system ATP-binding protein
MQTDVLLQMDQVSKAYPKQRGPSVLAINQISLQVKRGKLVCLVGPTGCGKSTLLRMAAGLEMPTSGVVLFEGEVVAQPALERGFVFQSYSAFPWLTVRENVAFGLPQARRRRGDPEVQEWIDAMGLNAFADALPRDLSGGMRQRLALARSLIVKPKLLLMDEPFGALDEHTRTGMQQILLEVVARLGCTVLFVTHDLRESILLGDQVVLLTPRPGSILQEFRLPESSSIPRDRLHEPERLALYQQLLDAFPS